MEEQRDNLGYTTVTVPFLHCSQANKSILKTKQRTNLCVQSKFKHSLFCKLTEVNISLYSPWKFRIIQMGIWKQRKSVSRIQAGHVVQMTALLASYSNFYLVFWGLLISKISSYGYSVNHRVQQLTTGRTQPSQLPAALRAAPSPASGHPLLLLLLYIISDKRTSAPLVMLPERLHPTTTPLMSSTLLSLLSQVQTMAVKLERLSSAEIKCGLR